MENVKTIGNSRYSIEKDKEGLWFIKEVYDDGITFAFSSTHHTADRNSMEEKMQKINKEGIIIFGGTNFSYASSKDDEKNYAGQE